MKNVLHQLLMLFSVPNLPPTYFWGLLLFLQETWSRLMVNHPWCYLVGATHETAPQVSKSELILFFFLFLFLPASFFSSLLCGFLVVDLGAQSWIDSLLHAAPLPYPAHKKDGDHMLHYLPSASWLWRFYFCQLHYCICECQVRWIIGRNEVSTTDSLQLLIDAMIALSHAGECAGQTILVAA